MLLTDLFLEDNIEALRTIVKSREKNSFADFTLKEKKIISNDILTIVKKYPQIKKIWLTGSYVCGGHVLPNDDKTYLKLRKYFKLKLTLSDRDYITQPKIVDKFDMIDLLGITKNKAILIFDDGFNLLKKK